MTQNVYLVAGLAYGDEGKGATVDFLARRRNAGLVVRYNGGAQAAHNVVTLDGRQHTFSQFGSGTFVDGVQTFLSRFVLVNPQNLMNEGTHLRNVSHVRDAFDRIYVSENALVITPFQIAINRALELSRGANRHTSCGQGIGVTRELHIKYGEDVLFVGDLRSDVRMKEKLAFLQTVCLDYLQTLIGQTLIGKVAVKDLTHYAMWKQLLTSSYEIERLVDVHKTFRRRVKIIEDGFLSRELSKDKPVIFEGAQGVLLDEVHGEAPYNTWTDTTYNNAYKMLEEAGYAGTVSKIGVLRTYLTRHGAGPLATENAGLRHRYPEPHNGTGTWQGPFRIGTFDPDLLNKSLAIVNGVDGLALNHLDREEHPAVIADKIAEALRTPVAIFGYGPSAQDRSFVKGAAAA